MTEPKASSKKKTGKAKRERKERRFEPSAMQTSQFAVIAGILGAFALGVGVYAQWIREEPLEYATFIVAGGAVALGIALWFGESGALPVRVGDAGVAIEKENELVRLMWCDMERIAIERGNLVARGDELTLTIPVKAHPVAVAWILSEGVRRVPKALDVKSSETASLPKPGEGDGELVKVEGLQVAGRHCASSNKPISFERDARMCPNCGQVYHKDHVPQSCVTCSASLAGRADPC